MKRFWLILLGTLSLSLAASLMLGMAAGREPSRAAVKAQLADADERVSVIQTEDGAYRFVLMTPDGDLELTPDEFAARVHEEQSSRPFLMVLLNITSYSNIAWVVLGFAGQAVFTGRMVVQWLTSEKRGRSVVPTAFWWMSLAGATMLLTYFIWRKDIVAVLGQSTGWFIYLRNLYFIYVKHSLHGETTGDSNEA